MEKEVAFAGPYLLTGQRLLMRKGDTEGTVWVNDDKTGSLYTKEVRSYVDLPPKTDVCTAADSTSQKKLKSLKTDSGEKQFDVTPLTDYGLCISGLLDTTYGKVGVEVTSPPPRTRC
ncbi:type 2 periplasmic-binding domain-containing protein [Streptomyces malaysiensis]|uniref:hypothetical protein n=1 Tax=Streptomyces malaysiensis TaxID=92644 RepID=UPI0037143D6E